MTLSFVPGTYEFTATTWMADGPAGDGHLKLDLAAHHHYYIELRDCDSFPPASPRQLVLSAICRHPYCSISPAVSARHRLTLPRVRPEAQRSR
jgi:hypothetical protein